MHIALYLLGACQRAQGSTWQSQVLKIRWACSGILQDSPREEGPAFSVNSPFCHPESEGHCNSFLRPGTSPRTNPPHRSPWRTRKSHLWQHPASPALTPQLCFSTSSVQNNCKKSDGFFPCPQLIYGYNYKLSFTPSACQQIAFASQHGCPLSPSLGSSRSKIWGPAHRSPLPPPPHPPLPPATPARNWLGLGCLGRIRVG